MRAHGCLVVFLCLLVSPCLARPSIEIGNSPAVGVNWEWPRMSLGLGLGFNWLTYDQQYSSYDPITGRIIVDRKVTVAIIQPALSWRGYLAGEQDVRPFLTGRVARQLPITSGDPYLEHLNRDVYDNWSFTAGGGLSASLARRLAILGDAGVTVIPRSTTTTGPSGYSTFGIHLVYRL